MCARARGELEAVALPTLERAHSEELSAALGLRTIERVSQGAATRPWRSAAGKEDGEEERREDEEQTSGQALAASLGTERCIMLNQVEKLASEVMGAVKSVKATFEHLTGVFKELTREHGEVSVLLSRVKRTSDPEVRRQLFPTIRERLLSHEKGELSEVYPAFRSHPELAPFAERHEREAGALERMIEQLSAMGYADAGWGSAFKELVSAVERHVKEEEDEFFPAASKTLGKEMTEQMKARYLAAKGAR